MTNAQSLDVSSARNTARLRARDVLGFLAFSHGWTWLFWLIAGRWWAAILLLYPALALLSTSCGVIASSRINDPRAAQQVTALFIVPLIGISLAVLIGKIYPSTTMIMWATVALVLINAGVLWLAVRLFQREMILTRCK